MQEWQSIVQSRNEFNVLAFAIIIVRKKYTSFLIGKVELNFNNFDQVYKAPNW